MKCLLLLTLTSLVALSMGNYPDFPNGCIYVNGRCYEGCEEGTHSYTTGCGYLKPEPTCAEPNPVEDTRGHICDYSACYCNDPTVRHPDTKKCVPREECPKTESENKIVDEKTT